MDNSIKEQKEYISLLLKNKLLVEDWINSTLGQEYFDKQFYYIINAIIDAYEKDSILTRKYYNLYLDKFISKKKDRLAQEHLFNQIYILNSKVDEFVYLQQKIIDLYLDSSSYSLIEDFHKIRDQKGNKFAIQNLLDGFNSLMGDVDAPSIFYESIGSYADQYWKEAEKIDEDSEPIKCWIKEIDSVIGSQGFFPGTLSLFTADVGAFKTTMMMNIGLNIWKYSKRNVLFVPLEMPRRLYMQRLISRETGIPYHKLLKREYMSDEEWKLATQTTEKWKDLDHNVYIMESMEDHVKVSVIKQAIKKHIEIFKPETVIVDYIANLVPDFVRKDRNDLEIGEMLRTLQNMGKPGVLHEKGFSVISAAQLGRDALKRARKEKEKIGFYSEDVRGAHDYSMYSTNMFGQWKDLNQNDQLWIMPIKCRYGKTTFDDGSAKTRLEVRPEIGLIKSIEINFGSVPPNEVLTKSDADIEDPDIFAIDEMDDLSVVKNENITEGSPDEDFAWDEDAKN